MNNEQLDSQLSAMFDDELPEPECELLARRLARDEGLKARWGRYAVIAACIRMERGGEAAPAAAAAAAARASGSQIDASNGEVRSSGGEARLPRMRLNGGVATRVSRMIAAEPPLLAGAGAGRNGRGLARPAMRRWWQPVAGGAAVAAGVAAAAILWLRAGSPDAPIVAQTTVLASTSSSAAPSLMRPSGVVQIAARSANVPRAVRSRSASRSTPDSFIVPPPAPPSAFAPPVELANFVVVHSEYSMPLLRRSALSALVAAEPMTDDAAENPPASERSVSGPDAAGNAANAPHADYAQ